MKRAAGIILGMALPTTAWAFPENIRHGYQVCTTCHVSPQGGGTLNDYGRGTSGAFMSTWGDDTWGAPLYDIPAKLTPEWIHVGGDQRAVDVVRQDRATGQLTSLYIPMEESLEVAVSPPNNPGVTLDAEAGLYGPAHQLQYRRMYLKLDVSENVGFKVGHFFPSYGVNFADHTTPTRDRLGFGEGRETYNAEAYWNAPAGEVTVTSIFGSDLAVDLNNKHPGAYQTDTGTGWSARAAAYVAAATQVGVSAMSVTNFETGTSCWGGHVMHGYRHAGYIIAELDRCIVSALDQADATPTVGTLKVGYEMYRGVLANLQAETVDAAPAARLGLQWIPVPHIEVLGEIRRSWSAGFRDGTTSGLLLIHHWI